LLPTFCGLAYVPHSRNLILTTTVHGGITPNRCYVLGGLSALN